MQLLGTPLEQVTWPLLERLVVDQVPESRTHGYKSKNPDRRDEPAKSRLLKSVSAFANTAGGVLVFGVDSETGGAWEIPGLLAFDPDGDVATLGNLLRSGLEPVLPRLEPRIIEGAESKRVLLLGVPRSLAAPHQVSLNYGGGFWARDHRGNYPMSVEELRRAFQEADAWQRDADAFRTRRLETIKAGQVHPQIDGSKDAVIVQVVPLGRLRTSIDAQTLLNFWRSHPLESPFAMQAVARPNVDGWLALSLGDQAHNQYVQAFRSGAVELYWALQHFSAGMSSIYLEGPWFEEKLGYQLATVLEWLRHSGVGAPYAIYATILLAHGRKFVAGQQRYHHNRAGFDRPELQLPPVVVEELPESLDSFIRPFLDLCWQAAGWDRSPHFDEQGKWKLLPKP